MTAGGGAARLATKSELAERWGVSTRTVQRLVNKGYLHAVRIGRQLRFTADDIAAHERAQRT